MKKILLFISILLLSFSLFSSSFSIGLEGGVNRGSYKQYGGDREGKTFSSSVAFDIAIPIEYRINNFFSLSSGIRYIEKAYKTDNNPYPEEGSNYVKRNSEHFFEFPLSIRINVANDNFRGFLGLGGYLGVRFLSLESGMLDLRIINESMYFENYRKRIELNPSSDNLFDAGLLFEVGASFTFCTNYEVYLLSRYQYSLTMLDKNYQRYVVPRYIDTFSFDVGFAYKFGGRV